MKSTRSYKRTTFQYSRQRNEEPNSQFPTDSNLHVCPTLQKSRMSKQLNLPRGVKDSRHVSPLFVTWELLNLSRFNMELKIYHFHSNCFDFEPFSFFFFIPASLEVGQSKSVAVTNYRAVHNYAPKFASDWLRKWHSVLPGCAQTSFAASARRLEVCYPITERRNPQI